MDFVCLKLDEDDEDDEVAQTKLPIVVAKDVKTGTYAASCVRNTGVSEYAMSRMVRLLCRLGDHRAILHSDGESSIVPFKTVTLLAAPFVEWVFA